MTDEILNEIKSVFNRDYDLLLSPQEIYNRMKHKGFFKAVEYKKAIVDIRVHLVPPMFYHRVITAKGEGVIKDGWALARRFHVTEKESPQDDTAFHLQIGKELLRTISASGTEIENGTIPLRGQEVDSFFASMDEEQRNRQNIDIYYSANESATCNIVEDELNHWHIKSAWLRDWYKENKIEPSDIIWLAIASVAPLKINIYTKWERDPDAYRRYKLQQEEKPLPSVDLPISYIIWDFFERTQKIAHRRDIAKEVLAKRPKVSEQSVYSRLSANPYFVQIGEGKWGLKEWGLEKVTRAVRPVGSPLEENANLPTETVPLDYILVTIASENFVYSILRNSKEPLTVDEITERIAKILYVDKKILARTTFFDASDARFIRLQDGTFTLRENLEDVIHQLAERERETKTSLEREIYSLKSEMEFVMSRHEKQVAQIKQERDILQNLAEEWIERHEVTNNLWEKRSQLLSEFFTGIIPHIGQNKLKEIFEQLRQKSEMGGANESI